MKERLYYQDAYLRYFTAEVVERGTDFNGGYYVELSQTAFYPTGGGQPCDLGKIEDVEVTGVEEVDGQIRHYLAKPLSEHLQTVKGSIDWNRRFDHMQQHTGQHILSASFRQIADILTIGFHLGREIVTIDLDTPELSEELIQQAEDLANRVVVENRRMEARFVDEAELATLPVNKAPSVQENIRLVIIPEFDYNPCGGTHPSRTGEVGMIKVIGWERNKGKVRLSFVCGFRALELLREKQAVLQQLTRLMTCGESELTTNISRLMDEQKETGRLLQEARQELLQYEGNEMLQQAERWNGMRIVSRAYRGRSMQDLQKMAQHLTASDTGCVVLLVSVQDKCQLVFARGESVPFDANWLLKQVLPLIEGKGGGKPEMAQGGGTASRDPEEILQAALSLVKKANSPA